MFSASAPAKVILFGEHAVVYNQPALAVPVSSLRATAEVVAQTAAGTGTLVLTMDLDTQDKVTQINAAFSRTIALVEQALKLNSLDFEVRIVSQIPIASGLGSGAAVTAALARVLAMACGRSFDSARLNDLVYEVEKLHHGTPSGIDNTVIVYEKPVYFVRNQPLEILSISVPFELVIADTGQSALTHVAVGDVRKLFEKEPAHIGSIVEAVGDIARTAREKIRAGETAALGQLMVQNHALLRELTVSSPILDRLVQAALDAGALGAKLSGGGRGGNMIALVTAETRETVSEALIEAGAARVFTTTVRE